MGVLIHSRVGLHSKGWSSWAWTGAQVIQAQVVSRLPFRKPCSEWMPNSGVCKQNLRKPSTSWWALLSANHARPSWKSRESKEDRDVDSCTEGRTNLRLPKSTEEPSNRGARGHWQKDRGLGAERTTAPSIVGTCLFMVLFCFKLPRAPQGRSTQGNIQASHRP